jgi:hypothetical protein
MALAGKSFYQSSHDNVSKDVRAESINSHKGKCSGEQADDPVLATVELEPAKLNAGVGPEWHLVKV